MLRAFLLLLATLALMFSANIVLADSDWPEEETDVEDVTQLGPQFYRWTDSEGRIQFSDRPPTEQTNDLQQDSLKPAQEIGGGSQTNSIYQRTNQILDPSSPSTSHQPVPE